MKFFRKGISTIVLSSKLLLVLGVGLPFCSFQKIYAGPQKELLELSKKSDLTVRDINSAINNLEQDSTSHSQSSYITILKNLNINSTNPEMVDAIKSAFQKAADLINGIFSKSAPGRSQSFYQNKDFIFNTLEQINRKATSRATSSNPTIKAVPTSKTTSSTNPQPTVEADLEKALQNSIKTAKEDDERRAKALEAQRQAAQKAREDQLRLQQEQAQKEADELRKKQEAARLAAEQQRLEAQRLAEQKRQVALAEKQKQEKEAEELRKKQEADRLAEQQAAQKAAQITSTSSALKTTAKVAGAAAIVVSAGLIGKAFYDKVTAPSTVATPSTAVDCTQFFNRDTNVPGSSSPSSDTDKNKDKKNVIEVVENTPASSSSSPSSAQIDEPSEINEKADKLDEENHKLEKEIADAEAEDDDDKFFDARHDNANTNFHPGDMALSGVSTMFKKAERDALEAELNLNKATTIGRFFATYKTLSKTEKANLLLEINQQLAKNPELKKKFQDELNRLDPSFKTKLASFLKRNGWNVAKIGLVLTFLYAISAGLNPDLPGHEAIASLASTLGTTASNLWGYFSSLFQTNPSAPTCPMLPNGVTVQDVCNSPYSQLPGQYGIDCPAPTATLDPTVSAPTAVAQQAITPWYCVIRRVTDPILSLGGLIPHAECH